ncbi:hypothetical protein BaRGS_00032199 [Batillaria attramentaria]|uniref:Uncharacterized protein n=1 Tax=Batillaria attramentaria TaxID=370345 RepID=A0ABD0JPE0_9CAEN
MLVCREEKKFPSSTSMDFHKALYSVKVRHQEAIAKMHNDIHVFPVITHAEVVSGQEELLLNLSRGVRAFSNHENVLSLGFVTMRLSFA